MAKRKDPASEAVAFFETASVETAETVLNICRGVVARRKPATTRKPRAAKPSPTTDTSTKS